MIKKERQLSWLFIHAALYQETLQAALFEIASIEGEDHQSLQTPRLGAANDPCTQADLQPSSTVPQKRGCQPSLSWKTEMLLDLIDSIMQSNGRR